PVLRSDRRENGARTTFPRPGEIRPKAHAPVPMASGRPTPGHRTARTDVRQVVHRDEHKPLAAYHTRHAPNDRRRSAATAARARGHPAGFRGARRATRLRRGWPGEGFGPHHLLEHPPRTGDA